MQTEERKAMIEPTKQAICQNFDTQPEDLMGPSRIRYIVEAKFALQRIMYEDYRFSYWSIADVFGTTHKQVMHAVKRCRELCDCYPHYKTAYEKSRPDGNN